jgi:hypothetical protein
MCRGAAPDFFSLNIPPKSPVVRAPARPDTPAHARSMDDSYAQQRLANICTVSECSAFTQQDKSITASLPRPKQHGRKKQRRGRTSCFSRRRFPFPPFRTRDTETVNKMGYLIEPLQPVTTPFAEVYEYTPV